MRLRTFVFRFSDTRGVLLRNLRDSSKDSKDSKNSSKDSKDSSKDSKDSPKDSQGSALQIPKNP